MRTGGFGFDRQFGYSVPAQQRDPDPLGSYLAQLEARGQLESAWYLPATNPSQYLTLSGANVTTWAASHGAHKVDFTEATNRPQWDATLFNNKGGVTFNGTTQYLTNASSIAAWPGASADFFMFLAVRNDLAAATGGAVRWFAYGEADTDQERYIGRFSNNVGLGEIGGTFLIGATGGAATGAHTLGLQIDVGGTSALFIDGVQDITAATATAPLTQSRARLGASAGSGVPGTFLTGAIVCAAVLGPTAVLDNLKALDALARARLS